MIMAYSDRTHTVRMSYDIMGETGIVFEIKKKKKILRTCISPRLGPPGPRG